MSPSHFNRVFDTSMINLSQQQSVIWKSLPLISQGERKPPRSPCELLVGHPKTAAERGARRSGSRSRGQLCVCPPWRVAILALLEQRGWGRSKPPAPHPWTWYMRWGRMTKQPWSPWVSSVRSSARTFSRLLHHFRELQKVAAAREPAQRSTACTWSLSASTLGFDQRGPSPGPASALRLGGRGLEDVRESSRSVRSQTRCSPALDWDSPATGSSATQAWHTVPRIIPHLAQLAVSEVRPLELGR